MATFVLNSIIKIGDFKPFRGLHEVVVKKSIRNFNDTAIIKLPASSVVVDKKQNETKSVDTAKAFKRGDKVNVQLGYNGQMREEFEGFIARINKSTPCEIECEGYAFQLRGKQVNKVWKNATLSEVLKEIVSGTDIIIDPNIDDINVDVIQLIKKSGFEALTELGKQLKGAVAFWFDKNILFAGLALTQMSERNRNNKPDVKFKIGYNVVRENQMKERLAGDNQYEVELVYKEKDGKKNIAKVGVPNSNSIRKNIQAVKDNEWRQKMAAEMEQRENYSGFDGKITAFLQPYCKPTQKMNIEDPRYSERSGNYLIESTELKFGRSGARRIIGISIKL